MEKHIEDLEKKIVDSAGDVVENVEKHVQHYRASVLARFPFLIIGLSTFGLVAVLYAFEQVIEMIPVLAENPLYVFTLGIAALTATGTLYKKLQ